MNTVVYMAISLNGMVATGQGETPWGEASWANYVAKVNHFGNMIVGSKTYDGMREADDFKLFEGTPKVIVVSSQVSKDNRVSFVTSPEAAIAELQKTGFEDILIGGGPGLATSMIAAGLVDELHLDVEPLLLGNVLPLLNQELMCHLQLISVDRYDAGGVTLQYKVEKPS